jgi:replication factor C subunit 2/4
MRSVVKSQGPPGTGKTTSILALAHGLLGSNYREGVLELNASDDRCTTMQWSSSSPRFTYLHCSGSRIGWRSLSGNENQGPSGVPGKLDALRADRGIDVVRNKIKMFAQKKVTLPPGRHKIVILDEADRCACCSWGRTRSEHQPTCDQGPEYSISSFMHWLLLAVW